MSAKWVRSKKWDDRHLSGSLTPIKWMLRALSSIPLAIVLLGSVALYGALASIPVGMFAQIPTWTFYILTYLVTIALLVGGPWLLARSPLRQIRKGPTRFLISFLTTAVLIAVGSWLWLEFIWPAVRYVPGNPPTGIRFFGDFSDAHRRIMLRQMPGWEMTELEFYGWWPFKLVLSLFVINMIVATVRRIEFKFVNVGVLTVHTGIVLMSIGSVSYSRAKVEGDMVLVKNQPPRDAFYDNIKTALYVHRAGDPARLTFPLPRLPRYNTALAGSEHAPDVAVHEDPNFQELYSTDLQLRVVGIVPYGVREEELVDGSADMNPSLNATIEVEVTDEHDRQPHRHPVWNQRLVGTNPARGTGHTADFTIQHLVEPSHQRVADLSTQFDEPSQHYLIVRIPEAGYEKALAVQIGDEIKLGETGWSLRVDSYQASNEGLALISRGYEGAASSRLRVEITDPEGKTVQRSILHRYPELTQDFLETSPGQPPRRQPPNPEIDITYLDATKPHLFVVQSNPARPVVDVIRRDPGGGLSIAHDVSIGSEGVAAGQIAGHNVFLKLDDYWQNTTFADRIRPVPVEKQNKDERGTFVNGFLDVEVRMRQPDGRIWERRAWVEFSRYPDASLGGAATRLAVPGFGVLQLQFSRLVRPLPGINLELTDFEMIPYPGSNTPRDYVSTLNVYSDRSPDGDRHVTRLNHPYIYRVPFEWRDSRSFVGNCIAWIRGLIVPNQYKFSQAGWDPARQQFTVLGVGNNTGIYIIAMGGILTAAGIPWAFYVKPAILKYRKRKLQRELALHANANETRTTLPRNVALGRNSKMNSQSTNELQAQKREPVASGSEKS